MGKSRGGWFSVVPWGTDRGPSDRSRNPVLGFYNPWVDDCKPQAALMKSPAHSGRTFLQGARVCGLTPCAPRPPRLGSPQVGSQRGVHQRLRRHVGALVFRSGHAPGQEPGSGPVGVERERGMAIYHLSVKPVSWGGAVGDGGCGVPVRGPGARSGDGSDVRLHAQARGRARGDRVAGGCAGRSPLGAGPRGFVERGGAGGEAEQFAGGAGVRDGVAARAHEGATPGTGAGVCGRDCRPARGGGGLCDPRSAPGGRP